MRYRDIESERTREEIFHQFMRKFRKDAENDFVTMLRGFPKITIETKLEGDQFKTIQELLRVLCIFLSIFYLITGRSTLEDV